MSFNDEILAPSGLRVHRRLKLVAWISVGIASAPPT